MIIPNIWENKKCSKPPTSCCFKLFCQAISWQKSHPTRSLPPFTSGTCDSDMRRAAWEFWLYQWIFHGYLWPIDMWPLWIFLMAIYGCLREVWSGYLLAQLLMNLFWIFFYCHWIFYVDKWSSYLCWTILCTMGMFILMTWDIWKLSMAMSWWFIKFSGKTINGNYNPSDRPQNMCKIFFGRTLFGNELSSKIIYIYIYIYIVYIYI